MWIIIIIISIIIIIMITTIIIIGIDMGLTTWFCLEISLKKNRCHVYRLRRFRPQVWKTMGCRGSKTIPSSGPVDCGGFHKSWEYPRDMDMDGLFPWENPWNHGWFGESPELERKPLLLIPLVGHHFIIARKWWMWIVSAHVWISHCHRCWHSFQAKQRILVLLSDWAYFPFCHLSYKSQKEYCLRNNTQSSGIHQW